MIDFTCDDCTTNCCERTGTKMADGNWYGIYLTPVETDLFPSEAVSPLFKANDAVIAYQISRQVCPHLTSDRRCGIYASRPLGCRAYPVMQRGLVQNDCGFVRKHVGELISVTSLADAQQAYDEQQRQAMMLPPAQFKWPLNLGRWIPA